jgi:hypothetical protein
MILAWVSGLVCDDRSRMGTGLSILSLSDGKKAIYMY